MRASGLRELVALEHEGAPRVRCLHRRCRAPPRLLRRRLRCCGGERRPIEAAAVPSPAGAPSPALDCEAGAGDEASDEQLARRSPSRVQRESKSNGGGAAGGGQLASASRSVATLHGARCGRCGAGGGAGLSARSSARSETVTSMTVSVSSTVSCDDTRGGAHAAGAACGAAARDWARQRSRYSLFSRLLAASHDSSSRSGQSAADRWPNS